MSIAGEIAEKEYAKYEQKAVQLDDIKRLIETAIGGGTVDLSPTTPGYPTQYDSRNNLLLHIYAIVNRPLK